MKTTREEIIETYDKVVSEGEGRVCISYIPWHHNDYDETMKDLLAEGIIQDAMVGNAFVGHIYKGYLIIDLGEWEGNEFLKNQGKI